MTEWVYFVEYPEVGIVKIGYSTNLQLRISELQRWIEYENPYTGVVKHVKGYLVLTIKGGTEQLERALHYRYRKHRAYLHEGFRAAWVLPTLDTLDLHEVLDAYLERPEEEVPFDEDITEVFPKGFQRVDVPAYAIERMVQDDKRHREQVRALEF